MIERVYRKTKVVSTLHLEWLMSIPNKNTAHTGDKAKETVSKL
jgi:hypothetical protein